MGLIGTAAISVIATAAPSDAAKTAPPPATKPAGDRPREVPEGWELAPNATLTASQTPGEVILKANGQSPSAGYEVGRVRSTLRTDSISTTNGPQGTADPTKLHRRVMPPVAVRDQPYLTVTMLSAASPVGSAGTPADHLPPAQPRHSPNANSMPSVSKPSKSGMGTGIRSHPQHHLASYAPSRTSR